MEDQWLVLAPVNTCQLMNYTQSYNCLVHSCDFAVKFESGHSMSVVLSIICMHVVCRYVLYVLSIGSSHRSNSKGLMRVLASVQGLSKCGQNPQLGSHTYTRQHPHWLGLMDGNQCQTTASGPGKRSQTIFHLPSGLSHADCPSKLHPIGCSRFVILPAVSSISGSKLVPSRANVGCGCLRPSTSKTVGR